MSKLIKKLGDLPYKKRELPNVHFCVDENGNILLAHPNHAPIILKQIEFGGWELYAIELSDV